MNNPYDRKLGDICFMHGDFRGPPQNPHPHNSAKAHIWELEQARAEDARLLAAKDAEIEQLREERRWIPVTERLPSHLDEVLVVTEHRYEWEDPSDVTIDREVCEAVFFSPDAWSAGEGTWHSGVTHWQPKPKPPAKDQE